MSRVVTSNFVLGAVEKDKLVEAVAVARPKGTSRKWLCFLFGIPESQPRQIEETAKQGQARIYPAAGKNDLGKADPEATLKTKEFPCKIPDSARSRLGIGFFLTDSLPFQSTFHGHNTIRSRK